MPVVNVLTSKGWAVQLVHDSTEPTEQEYGFVLIKDADGNHLVDCQDFHARTIWRHNRQDYYTPGWNKQLAQVLSPVPDAKAGGADCAASVDLGPAEAGAQAEAGGA